MRDKKYYIALDDFERRVVVNCLNEMRNNLIAKGKYTDAVALMDAGKFKEAISASLRAIFIFE